MKNQVISAVFIVLFFIIIVSMILGIVFGKAFFWGIALVVFIIALAFAGSVEEMSNEVVK